MIADLRRTALALVVGMILVLFFLRKAGIGNITPLEVASPLLIPAFILVACGIILGLVALAAVAIDRIAGRKAERQALDAELARHVEEERIREQEAHTRDEQTQVEFQRPPTTADFVKGLTTEFDKKQAGE